MIPGVNRHLNLVLENASPLYHPVPQSVPTWPQTANELTVAFVNAAPKILFVGDSITQGWPWWFEPILWTTTYFPALPIPHMNLGIGGNTALNSLWQLNALANFSQIGNAGVETLAGVDHVVLMIGTGDVNATPVEHYGKEVADIIVTRILLNVATLVNLNPNLKVLLYKIFPRFPFTQPVNTFIGLINSRLAEVVGLETSSLHLREVSNFVEADFIEPPDGIHLTLAGYARWASHIEPEITGWA